MVNMRDGSDLDFEEIRQNLTGMFSATVGIVGLVVAGILFPGPNYHVWRVFVFFAFLLVGLAAYLLRLAVPWLSRAILLLGATAALALGQIVLPWPGIPYFATLIVIMAASLTLRLGLAMALLNTAAIVTLSRYDPHFWPSLILLWATLALEWMASSGLYTVANWAWNSQQRAMRLLADLRQRQEELNRTVTALTEATRRLERTGYELAVARLHAEEARQLKARFAANISHELRTPLNLILGFSEMMYFRPQVYGAMQWPSGLRRDVHHIYQGSRQLLELINDVLDLSRIDGARMTINREPSDLGEVIEEAVATIRSLLRGRPIELAANVPADLPTIDLDRTRIRQVLLNLLNNAARFTDAGRIGVAATLRERDVLVCVADTGVGIPEIELSRIFEEFHQVDMSLRRNREGAGLGLAISKRFVSLHGGRVWAESDVGQGSRFFFTLPLSPDAAAGQLRHVGRITPVGQRYEPAVLLLEPDPAVREMLQRRLEGYRLVAVGDVEEVPEMARQWHPRALLVNVSPGAPLGQNVQRRILENLPSQVPVLFCSLPSQNWLSLETGVLDSLTKPISRQQLLGAMAQVPQRDRVLIIDDDRRFVQLMARFLESDQHPYQVRWAYDGHEGLALVQQERPDIILLDLIMPGMDGFALLERLQAGEETASIPVIIVTATDFGEELLNSQGSELSIVRRTGLAPGEVLRYLQVVLDETRVVYPTESAADMRAAPRG